MFQSNILNSVYIYEYILIPGQCLIIISRNDLSDQGLLCLLIEIWLDHTLVDLASNFCVLCSNKQEV